ncbi:MAG: hypothetical protein PWQ55_625 [Chloroflexota bacterium]|nr:hypothetical protein [Chloroflexota bacterium]
MRKTKVFFMLSLAMLALMSCEFAGVTIDFGNGSSSQPAAAPVEAGIDSPANGSSMQMSGVDISYHASSTDGISAVELSIDGTVVSSIATPGSDQKVVALKYTWQPMAAGNHTISVRAQSTTGSWSDYATNTVSIAGSEQAPADAPAPAQPETPPEPTSTPKPQPTDTPDFLTIFDVQHDKTKFYYGSNACGSHELTISARVTQPDDVYALILFIRFADKESSAFTKWDSGRAMSKKSDDLYSVTLTSTKVTNYNAYEFAVMRYQIVAQDKAGNSIARTEVMEDLNIEVCPN